MGPTQFPNLMKVHQKHLMAHALLPQWHRRGPVWITPSRKERNDDHANS